MSDEEIIAVLKSGKYVNYGMTRRNFEVINLMADLEKRGLIITEDCSTGQETQRQAH